MFQKLKGKFKYVLLMAIAVIASCVPAFAEGSGTANTNVTTAMSGLAADMVATGNALIPTALTVVGISMVVVFGVRVFKRIAKP